MLGCHVQKYKCPPARDFSEDSQAMVPRLIADFSSEHRHWALCCHKAYEQQTYPLAPPKR